MNTEITAMGSLGEGIGTLSDGMKVFVEGALPGETVEIALAEKKKNYAKARLIKVIDRSPDRVDPICPLFGTCGGCHLMHLSYAAQLEIKRQRVSDALSRLGKRSVPVAPCIPSPMPLHYRNKIQLPVEKDRIGLYRKKSHEIIDVPHCYIHNEQGGEVYDWIRTHLPHRESVRHLLLRSAIHTTETLVVLVTNGRFDFKPFASRLMEQFPFVCGVVENINLKTTNTILGAKYRTLLGRSYLIERLLDKQFKIGPASFFQVNTWQAENLIREVLRLAALQPHEKVYDAFTGVGTFALFAADMAKEVIGTECVAEAIACAKENAQLNHITNCHFEVAHATVKEVDLTLLNPPRKGCDPHVLENLSSERLIYISCDPATLARDLSLLPNYVVEAVTPCDLFPQTVHVETVASLRRSNN